MGSICKWGFKYHLALRVRYRVISPGKKDSRYFKVRLHGFAAKTFFFYWFSPLGNDCTQQCDRSASSLSPKTQNNCPTSQLESGSRPRRQNLLLSYCHKVGIFACLWCVCVSLETPLELCLTFLPSAHKANTVGPSNLGGKQRQH